MSVFQPPPTWALPVIVDDTTGRSVFNPIWLKWFVELAANLGAGGAGSGTVSSINVSGGTTGLTTSGGPVTTSGTITLAGVLNVANGGTGRNTGSTAYALLATGTTAAGTQQTLANAATTEILVGGGAAALPVWTTATGSGAPVRATSPTLITPTLGVATATSINGNTLTTGTWTLTGAAAKVLTFSNTLTLAGTDGSSIAFGAGGTVLYANGVNFGPNPVASITVANGLVTAIS